MAQFLNVRITSPEKIIWEGKARSVSSINVDGPFDILPEHANFITVVEGHALKLRTEDKKPLVFTFDKCVLSVHSNEVHIYSTQ